MAKPVALQRNQIRLTDVTEKPQSLNGPVLATMALLATLFLSRGIQQVIPVPISLDTLAFGILVAAVAGWMTRNSVRSATPPVEWAMVAYFAWNCVSMVASHEYPPGVQIFSAALRPEDVGQFSVPRFILTGTLIPFVCYAVGRYAVLKTQAVQALYWTVLLAAAYSAIVSILQFTGPDSLVWPPDIVDAPNWRDGRALGVFNHPVVNGMVLVIGFAIGTVLASRRTEPGWRRLVALTISIACGYGIYLTHTRAVWVSAAAILILGAALDKQLRKGYVAVSCLIATIIAANWTTFTSTDRSAGGIASQGEVFDRLNIDKTALWAASERPFTGWGIGRFPSVNTYHHQQWSEDTPWAYGFGNAAHENELGILAELGLFGLIPWLCVLSLLAYGAWRAYKTLPDDNLCGKPLAVVAILVFAVFVCTGLTVDLRFFSFPPTAVFLLIGIAIGWSDRLDHKQSVSAVRREQSRGSRRIVPPTTRAYRRNGGCNEHPQPGVQSRGEELNRASNKSPHNGNAANQQ